MDYKINNLKELVYKNYLKGAYGNPKIPSESEVMGKVEEITDRSYTPIVDNSKMENIELPTIRTKFGSIIDDISILFNAIEDESRDVLDQLTNSLREHNGVKRELKRIQARADDIINGKLGEEHLQYNFTESFNSVDQINTLRSDPIDTDGGVFTIRNNSANILSMSHYANKRLIFNVVENFAPIAEQGFIGDTNAENILSKNNPKSLTYKVKTLRPTSLKVITSLQLRADGKAAKINAVGVSVDSSLTGGYIRLFYQNGYTWRDVPGLGLQEAKGDSISFTFSPVEATHIKLEFIKNEPDVGTTNEYYVTIHDLVVSESSVRSTARLYSKPIILSEYDSESPVVSNISCVVDAEIPSDCFVKVFVAQDVRESGRFVDSNGAVVFPDSIDVVDFDTSQSGFVYLSDLLEKENLSGLIPYRGLDFDWKEIKVANALGATVPDVLEFNFTSREESIVNSVFDKAGSITWGDLSYNGPWPALGYTGVYVSGWCNSDNPAWSGFLDELVDSGVLSSGIDMAYLVGGWSGIADYGDGITTYPSGINPLILNDSNWSGQWLGYGSGYPYNYLSDTLDRIIRYGDYTSSANGWWRPYVDSVTPTGLTLYSESGHLSTGYGVDYGEFYFNGLSFYKIFKFGTDQTVLDSSIRLYQYEERPISSDSDTYNHMFRWRYKSALEEQIATLVDQIDATKYTAADFTDYTLRFPALNSNETYSDFDVIEVRQNNSNWVLRDRTDYNVKPKSDRTGLSGVILTPLTQNYPSLSPEGLSFDIKYSYKIENKYLSTWTSYAIVSPGISKEVEITNKNVYGKSDVKIIKEILLENLDDGTSSTILDAEGRFKLVFDTSNVVTNTHYKMTMFCFADEDTGFSAREEGSQRAYIPREELGNMTIPGGIKFVSRLSPMKVCDLGTLLYDTPMANDRKCALIDDVDGNYLVVKKPVRDSFPGYAFNSIDRNFTRFPNSHIDNKGHYIRKAFDSNDESITYTTGSSGNIIYNTLGEKDESWNDGGVLGLFRNTDDSTFYPLHSTYGHRLNLEPSNTITLGSLTLSDGDIDPRAADIDQSKVGSAEWISWISSTYPADYANYVVSSDNKYTLTTGYTISNRGYLFYNTAENLPAFYSISFNSVKEYDELSKRFLYQIELKSDSSKKMTPKVKSIRFEINKGL